MLDHFGNHNIIQKWYKKWETYYHIYLSCSRTKKNWAMCWIINKFIKHFPPIEWPLYLNEMSKQPNISHSSYSSFSSKNNKHKSKHMALKKISLFLLFFIFRFYSETAKSQYCGCSPILCCSVFGYCGITEEYCGSSCRSGPCRKSREPVDRIVTQNFFDGIISQASNGCPGKRFYTRDSFLEAANTNLNFSMSVTRLEIATMFAHFTHETQGT